MKTFFSFAVIILTFSCQKPLPDYIAPQYPAWYTLTSPIDDVIQGVWGDYDKTLLIATNYAIFRSENKGKNWQQVDQSQTGISGIVEHRDTLFAMNGIVSKDNIQLYANAGKYSVDDGNKWIPYRRYNPFFDTRFSNNSLYINSVAAPNGTVYRINEIFLTGVGTLMGQFDTPGVITTDGRRIDLPKSHQLRSLYMDGRNRLYLTGTDAICSQPPATQTTLFCNSKNGRGIVYISKQPLP